MSKIFAGLLVIIYVTMSVVAHGMPHETVAGSSVSDVGKNVSSCLDRATPSDLSCQSSSMINGQCESLHCAFHFVFLNQTNMTIVVKIGSEHLRPVDRQLVARLSKSVKKPPRVSA